MASNKNLIVYAVRSDYIVDVEETILRLGLNVRAYIDNMDERVFDFVMQNGTSKSPFCTQSSTAYYCPGRPGLQHYAITSQARYCF
ncbi:MAG: hypothetical protein RPU63_08225, partial [Candidatus Sedimenticola sp. (ex Thyasira tokunagai)]